MELLNIKDRSLDRIPSTITNILISNYSKANKRYGIKKKEIIYPDRDGKRMSDNTEQFNWIVKIKENLEILFENNQEVFIAGDLLWYPVEGYNKIRTAPDAMVVFGRPKGYRGSYKSWEEDNISPQVVFEILSPGNTHKEMEKKLKFYEKYGVKEYYEYDPDKISLKGWLRVNDKLENIEDVQGWRSPLLNVKIEIIKDDLTIFYPDGSPFLTPTELNRVNKDKIEEERLKAVFAEKRAEEERLKTVFAEKRAEEERLRAVSAESKIELMAKKLREFGIDINT